ncbi:MAG: hypothetical protein M3O09_16550 [Acidobacteriota bacterium]|nr:hypothetical protein [Acidobacteriota bacterium]
MTPESLARTVEDFLVGSSGAVVIEDGGITFDLAQAKYSISGEHNKCILHLWSSERNVVRRIIEAETRSETLRLAVQRLGHTKPTKLEICRERDRRSVKARRTSRMAYQRQLRLTLAKRLPEFSHVRVTVSSDLAHQSSAPVYAAGLVRRGQSSFAILGVNEQETQASIDASLTFGILWMDSCRSRYSGKMVVEGLKLFVPAGCSAIVRDRMAHLHPGAAKWQLYELDQREDHLREIDCCDRGNVNTRLVHWTNESSARERFAEPIGKIQELMPEAETAILSPGEIAFRCHGLEFARARLTQNAISLRSQPEIVFGIGSNETVLSESNSAAFRHIVRSIGEVRHPEGPKDHPLWRLHPERWLESLVVLQVGAIDGRLDPAISYSQVPAFSASDRAMVDVLTSTREGRLAVLELKADEDIHLPLQGLDYWSRVAWHQARGEFQRYGYFPGRELSDEPPLLFLVAPALHVHPATDTLLRYISPKIEWKLIGIDERWKENLRVIFRKNPAVGIGRASQQNVA